MLTSANLVGADLDDLGMHDLARYRRVEVVVGVGHQDAGHAREPPTNFRLECFGRAAQKLVEGNGVGLHVDDGVGGERIVDQGPHLTDAHRRASRTWTKGIHDAVGRRTHDIVALGQGGRVARGWSG